MVETTSTLEVTDMFGWYGHGGGPGWILLGLVNMALWIAIIAVVISLLRPHYRAWGHPPGTANNPPTQEVPSSAQRILQERLARGEVTEEDYRRLSSLLKES